MKEVSAQILTILFIMSHFLFQDEKAQLLITYLWMNYVKYSKSLLFKISLPVSVETVAIPSLNSVVFGFFFVDNVTTLEVAK